LDATSVLEQVSALHRHCGHVLSAGPSHVPYSHRPVEGQYPQPRAFVHAMHDVRLWQKASKEGGAASQLNGLHIQLGQVLPEAEMRTSVADDERPSHEPDVQVCVAGHQPHPS
jgi:hypothetical protein